MRYPGRIHLILANRQLEDELDKEVEKFNITSQELKGKKVNATFKETLKDLVLDYKRWDDEQKDGERDGKIYVMYEINQGKSIASKLTFSEKGITQIAAFEGLVFFSLDPADEGRRINIMENLDKLFVKLTFPNENFKRMIKVNDILLYRITDKDVGEEKKFNKVTNQLKRRIAIEARNKVKKNFKKVTAFTLTQEKKKYWVMPKQRK